MAKNMDAVNDHLQAVQISNDKIENFFNYYVSINKVKNDEDEHQFAVLSANIFGIELNEVKSLLKEIKANKKPLDRKITKEELEFYRNHVNTVKTILTASYIEKNFITPVTARRVKNFEITVEHGDDVTSEEVVYGLELLEIFFPINQFIINVHKKGDAPTIYKQLIRK